MHDPPTTPTASAPRRPWLPWLLAAIGVIVVAAVAIGTVIARDDDGNNNGAVTGSQKIANLQQACTQWHDTYAGPAAPPASWCHAMTGWMNGQMNRGHMTGTMMWGDPDRMLDTCRQWMATDPPGAGSAQDAAAWCDQMVGWMTQHIGDWDD